MQQGSGLQRPHPYRKLLLSVLYWLESLLSTSPFPAASPPSPPVRRRIRKKKVLRGACNFHELEGPPSHMQGPN